MAFFMVMFALSQVDAKKFKSLAISLGDAFNSPGRSVVRLGVGDDGRLQVLPRTSKPRQDPSQPDATETKPPKYRNLKELQAEFAKLVRENGLAGNVTVATNAKGDRLIVRLSDSLLFGVGSADLTDPAQELMDKVAGILLQADKRIRIEGHTDNVPIKSGRYRDNWDLSTERATNVLRYLEQRHGVDPQRLEAGGCGEYRPVADNDTPVGRAKNRRVEFVILDEEDTTPADERAVEG